MALGSSFFPLGSYFFGYYFLPFGSYFFGYSFFGYSFFGYGDFLGYYALAGDFLRSYFLGSSFFGYYFFAGGGGAGAALGGIAVLYFNFITLSKLKV